MLQNTLQNISLHLQSVQAIHRSIGVDRNLGSTIGGRTQQVCTAWILQTAGSKLSHKQTRVETTVINAQQRASSFAGAHQALKTHQEIDIVLSARFSESSPETK